MKTRTKFVVQYSLTNGQATTDSLTRDQAVQFCAMLAQLGCKYTVVPVSKATPLLPKMDED